MHNHIRHNGSAGLPKKERNAETIEKFAQKKGVNCRGLALFSNIVSGVIGIITTMILNGGWWLVVWFPWVSSHEVNVHNSNHLWGLIIYYLVAMILSVLIELLVNHLILRKEYPFKKTLNATLIANAFSYFVGAVLITILVIYVS